MIYDFSMGNMIFFEMDEWENDYIKKALETYSPQFYKETLTKNNVTQFVDATIISSMVYSTLTKEVLSQLPNLKLIATRTTGFDHIDLAYCKEKNIAVCNVPSYGEVTVAEHTFALLLALSRNIVTSIERTRRGNFSLDGLEGFDLNGKTMGVIGAGHIGKRVIEIARCFGMQVIVYAHHKDEELAKDPKIQFVIDLDLLLSRSDVVTLHIPGSPENNHMINLDNIKKFKTGSILLNTARGSLVDTQAIVYGLEKGILRGAGLDVLEEECGVKEEREILSDEFLKTCDIKTQLLNHVLLDCDNVIITPHNAFHSHEALLTILDTTVGNIRGLLDGKIVNSVSAT